ncbi:MAG: SoxR reducing system RseC family protein [Gammaproteobacteria bacterium]|nr:SoxR reducing system RseC family protein [Gammaproteobacteria bacterium]NND58633.1 SoxR reducing system RseC family protein [Gammaproteobacteria bacterium]
MIEESAEVTQADSTGVWIQCRSRSNCARCAAGRGCGGALLGSIGRNRDPVIHISQPGHDWRPGDTVRLQLPERRLLGAAGLAYGLPLATLLCGSLVGNLFGDPGAVVGAVAGLTGGVGLGRLLAGRQLPFSLTDHP